MPTEALLIAIQLAAAWWMAGVCWLVQMVVYPQFGRVGDAAFAAYHKFHMDRTGWVVVPIMLAELACAAAWVWVSPHRQIAWFSGGLAAFCWINTFAVEVPLHRQLKRGSSQRALRLLIWGNLPRTVAWTARGVLLLMARDGL